MIVIKCDMCDKEIDKWAHVMIFHNFEKPYMFTSYKNAHISEKLEICEECYKKITQKLKARLSNA